jgi:hypothetical protein
VNGAIVCDLEQRTQWDSSVAYDSEAIIQTHFKQSKFSIEIINMLKEYKNLNSLKDFSEEQKSRFEYLENYFDENGQSLADELTLLLNEIKHEQPKRKA